MDNIRFIHYTDSNKEQILIDLLERDRDLPLYAIYRHGATRGSERIKLGESKHGYTIYDVWTAHILPEAVPVLLRIAQDLKKLSIEAHISSVYYRCMMSAVKVGEVIDVNPKGEWRLMERIPLRGKEKYFHYPMLGSFLKSVKKQEFKRIAICTHEAVISGLVSILQETSFSMKDHYETGILVLCKGKNTYVINYNDTPNNVA